MSGAVYPLAGAQRAAVDPRESVWLSASAGTGKTQVLSARVLRLLLEPGADPSQILCLTFTKAGAAEMAVRVNEVLARWVRLDDGALGRELDYLGAPVDPATRARARALFARVLDCPGGGLRIDTIHAFAQDLLAAFPYEAQMLPGSRPMEDRERDLLSRDVLVELLVDGPPTVKTAIAEMSRRKGPDAVRSWLMRCAEHMELWTGPGAWQPPMSTRVHALLGIPADADAQWVAAACSDEVFPIGILRDCLPALRGWKAATGQKAADFVESWLVLSVTARFEQLSGFFDTLLKKDGMPRAMAGAEKLDPQLPQRQSAIQSGVMAVQERAALLDLATFLAPQLEAGREFALRWDAAKAREGLVDFDDLIARAAQLLGNSEMAAWIRYKLDRSFDHILVDEAQDTNRAQWDIIEALTDDFFSGEGAHGDAIRTIFTVGDFKQAIFGFQGTSPRNFRDARERVRAQMADAADAAGDMRSGVGDHRPLRDLDLDQSYRTAHDVLDFVDRAMEAIGPKSLGLEDAYTPHLGQKRPGLVTLWNVVTAPGSADDEDDDGQEEGWLSRHDRQMADRIAQQIKAWMDTGFPLVKSDPPRRATPGDVMVLVRKRRELAALIVARLYRHGVPVAGVDRLRLGNPLAVKDLMAAIRFAAQPLDDLTLANLIVSPLIGWSQQQLLDHGYRAPGVRLWEHLRESDDGDVRATVDVLREILRRADYDSPQALLHWILVGPMDGRRRLVARLGREANDPIDELLNAANAYASAHIVSLQGFIRWFDAGEGEIKRDAGEAADQVRVMTVHGSKGLQAPIVILADAAIGPDGAGDLALEEISPGMDRGRAVPLPGLTKEQKVGPVQSADAVAAAAGLEEHWRLLYVGMTRAEEALFIGGSLGPRDARKGPHADSWYARLLPLFEGDPLDDPIWGARWEAGEHAEEISGSSTVSPVDEAPEMPGWAVRPVGPEPRPPRPLAPSGLGEVEGSDPPLPSSQLVVAARRGELIHALLERMPSVPADERAERARGWLARQAADLDDATRQEMLDRALAVLDDPAFAAIFGPGSLAEIPLAATVDGQVVAGIADRLLVTPSEVLVVDFKTARRPPAALEEVPDATLRQLAAYVAALEVIYPGRNVRAAVLYTQTPQLIALPPAMLDAYKAAFAGRQESFLSPAVE